MRHLPAPTVLAALAVSACRPEAPPPTPLPAAVAGAASERSPGIVTLAAEVVAAEGARVTGAVVLTAEDGRLIVAAALDGLAPGAYLVHVMDGSACVAPGPGPSGGALGTFVADATGQARFSVEHAEAQEPAAFVGRAVAFHARGEDGARGALAGCGVLRPIAR